MKSADTEEMMNATATTIVMMKIIFSGPLFVLKFEAPDVPPDQPPRPASLCCKRTNSTRMADKII